MNIAGKVALITGSAHRVGGEIALTLAEKKAHVAIHYNSNKLKANQVVDEIRTIQGNAIAVQGNISKRDHWIKMKREILQKLGRIDILVNNAAIFYKTPFFEISDKTWAHFQEVNLFGTFLGCQIIGEEMMKNKGGKIINIADVSAETVWPSYIPYCVSKAGIVALTKGLAKALAPHVTVNAVSPGTVLLAETYDEEEEDNLLKRTPLQRIGSPRDIASTVAFLLEGTDFITGEIIKVDGGRSLQ